MKSQGRDEAACWRNPRFRLVTFNFSRCEQIYGTGSLQGTGSSLSTGNLLVQPASQTPTVIKTTCMFFCCRLAALNTVTSGAQLNCNKCWTAETTRLAYMLRSLWSEVNGWLQELQGANGKQHVPHGNQQTSNLSSCMVLSGV